MSPEAIAKELKRINASIPKIMRDNVAEEVDATPTIAFVMDEALKMDTIDPKLKDRIQHLKDAGEFNKKKVIENSKYTKLIDQYITREVNKAIKEGRLPKRRDIKNMEHVKAIKELWNQQSPNT